MGQLYQDILGPMLANIRGSGTPLDAYLSAVHGREARDLARQKEARLKTTEDILNQYRQAQMGMLGQITPYEQARLGLRGQELQQSAANNALMNQLRQASIDLRKQAIADQEKGLGGRSPQLIKLMDQKDAALGAGDYERANTIQGKINLISSSKGAQSAAAQLRNLQDMIKTNVSPESIDAFVKYSGGGGALRQKGAEGVNAVLGLMGVEPSPEREKELEALNNIHATMTVAEKALGSSMMEQQTDFGQRKAKEMLQKLQSGAATKKQAAKFFNETLPQLTEKLAQANLAGGMNAQQTLQDLAAGRDASPSGYGAGPATSRGLSGGIAEPASRSFTPEEIARLKKMGLDR